jgi:hypothetical protein
LGVRRGDGAEEAQDAQDETHVASSRGECAGAGILGSGIRMVPVGAARLKGRFPKISEKTRAGA